MKLVVIADDLTGAAEIAGVGLRHGLATRLVRGRPLEVGEGLTVIDTDSRLLAPGGAAKIVADFVTGLKSGDFDFIYKKTDSVLRGPVAAEIDALLAAFQLDLALLVPQNPSRGRMIRNGEYQIDGVPLDQTTFAHDPDHPARSARAVDLLGTGASRPIQCLDCFEDIPVGSVLRTTDDVRETASAVRTLRENHGIVIGSGDCAEHLAHWARQVRPTVLAAGGADFFRAMLQRHGLSPGDRTFPRANQPGTLWICGSASAQAHQLAERAVNENVAVVPMPQAVFDAQVLSDRTDAGAAKQSWRDAVVDGLQTRGRALVFIPQALDRSPGAARRLQDALAALAADVLRDRPVGRLLVEGGATASAVCKAMHWNQFDVSGEYADGVVAMHVESAAGPLLVVKPGSYPWPENVWKVE